MPQRISISLLGVFMLFWSGAVDGQYMTDPSYENIFPQNTGQFKRGGWVFGAGGGIDLPTDARSPITLIDNQDTSYIAEVEPSMDKVIYVEAGKTLMLFDWKLFEYMDYTLAYKKLTGKEKLTGRFTDHSNGGKTTKREATETIDEDYLTLNVDLNNVIQVDDDYFVQNTLGVDLNMRMSDQELRYAPPFREASTTTPENFSARVHYGLGFGWQMTDKLILNPVIETPILSAMPFDDGKSTIPILNSRFRPVFLSIRAILLQRHRQKGY